MAIKRTRNEYGILYMRAGLRGTPERRCQKPKGPELVGAFQCQKRRENLVSAATKVEAVDQLAADRLHVLFRVLEADQCRSGHSQAASSEEVNSRVLGAVARVAILSLPVETRDEVEAVFIAGADEPALILLRIQREAGRRVVEEVREGDALEACFGVTTGHISQQAREHHITDA